MVGALVASDLIEDSRLLAILFLLFSDVLCYCSHGFLSYSYCIDVLLAIPFQTCSDRSFEGAFKNSFFFI